MHDTADSRFLDHLYGAAVQPELWPSVMEELADMLGGTGAWLTRMSVADGSGQGVLARIDPAWATLYDTYYSKLNPFSNEADPAAFMATWRPEILTDEDWMPRDELERTPYYNEFMRGQGIHSGMIIRLAAHGFDVCALTMTRSHRQGHFTSDSVRRAKQVHGHLRRAFRLTQDLAMGGGALPGGVAEALDLSPQALIVLGTDGRIRRLNTRAEVLLCEGGGLRSKGGRLVAERAGEARTLEGLIAAAGVADPDQRRAGEMTLALSATRRAVQITVAPVRSVTTSVFEEGPAVIVSVNDPYGPGRREVGARDPGLTARERDALQWVAAGKSDWEIAVILGVSPTTVRFHVDNARKKLGAVNRAQAVALLLSADRPN